MNIWKLIHRQISVARVYGIPVRIDYRWFAVFALSVWLISLNLQRGVHNLPPVEPISAWILAVLTTLAFFLSVFGHELSHALVGRMEGIEIEEIVLHPFGGLARLKSEPDTPGAEFRIAVAGPAATTRAAAASASFIVPSSFMGCAEDARRAPLRCHRPGVRSRPPRRVDLS